MSNYTYYYKIVVNEYEAHMVIQPLQTQRSELTQNLPADPSCTSFKNSLVLLLSNILEFTSLLEHGHVLVLY